MLLVFAYYQTGTVIARSLAAGILLLAVGFLGAGYGPLLPRWGTVIGTNTLLLAACPVLHQGLRAYCQQRVSALDWLGWSIVLLAIPPFAYWGLVEPNGIYRSLVFSAAAALLNGRIAWLILRSARHLSGGAPLWSLGLLFLVITFSMVGRCLVLALAEGPPPAQRGANPTTWVVVFWYTLLIAFVTLCCLWLEVRRLQTQLLFRQGLLLGFLDPLHSRLIPLWSGVVILSAAAFSQIGISYATLFNGELITTTERSQLANDTLVVHTQHQVPLTDHYRQWIASGDGLVVLFGIEDRQVQAKIPNKLEVSWDDPLWQSLAESSKGSYRIRDARENIERFIYYQRVEKLPLVLVTGFSDRDIHSQVRERIRPILGGVVMAVIVIVGLALMLTLIIRQRDDQDRFLAMINHELKSPLSVIQIALGNRSVPDSIRERIFRAVREIDSILERTLQADRLQAGRVQLNYQSCDVVALLTARCAASSAPQRLILQISQAISSIRTDMQLVDIILANLIENGLKYSPPGGLVTLQVIAKSSYRRSGVLVVVANSPGLAGFPEAGQLFRKYYRAPGAKGKSGSGLGLHISQSLASHLGGWLRYRPTHDMVRFELWLPP